MSFVTRRKDFAARLAVEVAERQPSELRLHLSPQPRHRALAHHRREPPLEVAGYGGGQVDEEYLQEDLPEVVEVDAVGDGRRLHEVG